MYCAIKYKEKNRGEKKKHLLFFLSVLCAYLRCLKKEAALQPKSNACDTNHNVSLTDTWTERQKEERKGARSLKCKWLWCCGTDGLTHVQLRKEKTSQEGPNTHAHTQTQTVWSEQGGWEGGISHLVLHFLWRHAKEISNVLQMLHKQLLAILMITTGNIPQLGWYGLDRLSCVSQCAHHCTCLTVIPVICSELFAYTGHTYRHTHAQSEILTQAAGSLAVLCSKMQERPRLSIIQILASLVLFCLMSCCFWGPECRTYAERVHSW